MPEVCQHKWRQDLWVIAYVTNPEKVKTREDIKGEPRPVPLQRCPNCGAIRLEPPDFPPEGSGFL